MIQTQKKDVTRDLLPFSNIETLSVFLKGENRVKVAGDSEGVMELPVNNYLKTPDEIEIEFRYGINPRKLNLRKDNLNGITSIIKTDGYLNIHNLDEALSGFMEENY